MLTTKSDLILGTPSVGSAWARSGLRQRPLLRRSNSCLTGYDDVKGEVAAYKARTLGTRIASRARHSGTHELR